jgi:murein DD-endopeptidase MepM/ murein hydrolase activator NlpD
LLFPLAVAAFLMMLTPGAGTAADKAGAGLVPPLANAVVTQPFGCTDFVLEPAAPWCPTGHMHTGLDLAAPVGSPVHAAAAGVAEVIDTSGGYGLHVLLTHDPRLTTLYGHLSSVSVRTGQWVQAGDVVGGVGSTGLSTGPHLHFEVRKDARPVDPMPLLPPGFYQEES